MGRITASSCVFRGSRRQVYQREKPIAAFQSCFGSCLIVYHKVARRFVAPRLPFDETLRRQAQAAQQPSGWLAGASRQAGCGFYSWQTLRRTLIGSPVSPPSSETRTSPITSALDDVSVLLKGHYAGDALTVCHTRAHAHAQIQNIITEVIKLLLRFSSLTSIISASTATNNIVEFIVCIHFIYFLHHSPSFCRPAGGASVP